MKQDGGRAAPASGARPERPKYVPPRPPGTGDEGDAFAFTLTSAQLSALMARVVNEALSAHAGGTQLVDKQVLAQKLGCSAAHIDNLRKRGLPVVPLGELVRFDPAAVIEWLRQQSEEE